MKHSSASGKTQIVLAEKTKAQMEARDIMRENLNKDFLYFSPSALPWAGKKEAYRLCESNYMSTMGSLKCNHLATKEPGK